MPLIVIAGYILLSVWVELAETWAYMCVLETEEFGKAWKVSEESVKHLYPDFYDCMC